MDGHDIEVVDDSSPFGRPLFDSPKAKALERVGAIDIGSNSVRMVIFDGAARSPAYFYNEKIMCGLGESLGETGRLNPVGRDRALAALRRFALLLKSFDVKIATTVATAALRDATDGPEFRDQIEQETGLNVWVASGIEEARLSAQGVFLGWPGAQGLMCDIGGSSLELAELGDGTVGRRISSKLGPLKLMGLPGGKKGRKSVIDAKIDELREVIDGTYDRIFLVGGSWRAIARLDMERRGYPLHVLHEYRMTRANALKTVKWISRHDVSELRALTGNSEARMRLVPYAAEVLKSLVQRFHPEELATSAYGIREGLLYEQMPFELKRRDPLIEACRFDEKHNARLPGFGKTLYDFVLPVFEKADHRLKRLIKAACLLHDVSWRAHPDYRAEVCFDNATRANFGGLDHAGRIFLGVALLHRYRNSREGTRFRELEELLPAAQLQQAEVLGKAMRFGAMLSSPDAEQIGKLKWRPRKKRLELLLSKQTKDLFGEVAEARFLSFAQALGALETDIKFDS